MDDGLPTVAHYPRNANPDLYTTLSSFYEFTNVIMMDGSILNHSLAFEFYVVHVNCRESTYRLVHYKLLTTIK